MTSLLPNIHHARKSPWLLRNYEKFLAPIQHQPLKLLELGVQDGNSLRMWQDYLPNTIVVGLDVEPVAVEGIPVYCGGQEDTALLDEIAQEHAPNGFDVIIDDASHIGDLSRISFWHLFPNWLKSNGLYFIEDWGTGYWDFWPDGATYRNVNHVYGMVGFVKELIDECGIADATSPQFGSGVPRASLIAEMNIALSHVMVRKR